VITTANVCLKNDLCCYWYNKLYDDDDDEHSIALLWWQFGFVRAPVGLKAKSFTNLCSIALKESLAYYARHQSFVFCTFLDDMKAFDRIQYCNLFKLLVSCQVPAPINWALSNFYTSNYVRVAWCGIISDYFLDVNSVRQGEGGVLSPVLFCLYIDGLCGGVIKSRSGVFYWR